MKARLESRLRRVVAEIAYFTIQYVGGEAEIVQRAAHFSILVLPFPWSF